MTTLSFSPKKDLLMPITSEFKLLLIISLYLESEILSDMGSPSNIANELFKALLEPILKDAKIPICP